MTSALGINWIEQQPAQTSARESDRSAASSHHHFGAQELNPDWELLGRVWKLQPVDAASVQPNDALRRHRLDPSWQWAGVGWGTGGRRSQAQFASGPRFHPHAQCSGAARRCKNESSIHPSAQASSPALSVFPRSSQSNGVRWCLPSVSLRRLRTLIGPRCWEQREERDYAFGQKDRIWLPGSFKSRPITKRRFLQAIIIRIWGEFWHVCM